MTRWEAGTEFLGAGESASLEYATVNNKERAPNKGQTMHISACPLTSTQLLWHKMHTHIQALKDKETKPILNISTSTAQNSCASAPSAGPLEIKYDLIWDLCLRMSCEKTKQTKSQELCFAVAFLQLDLMLF